MKVQIAGYTITNVAKKKTKVDEAGTIFEAPEGKYLLIRGNGIVGTARSIRVYHSKRMIHSYNWNMLRHNRSGFSLRSPGTKMTWNPSRMRFFIYLGKVIQFTVNGSNAEIDNIKNWVVQKKNGSWIYWKNTCKCHTPIGS